MEGTRSHAAAGLWSIEPVSIPSPSRPEDASRRPTGEDRNTCLDPPTTARQRKCRQGDGIETDRGGARYARGEEPTTTAPAQPALHYFRLHLRRPELRIAKDTLA